MSVETPERVWVVWDEWRSEFVDGYETQREAQARADELNNDTYLRTISTWYERYSVDSLPVDEAEDECGVHWRVA
jgi:hypothetical protein